MGFAKKYKCKCLSSSLGVWRHPWLSMWFQKPCDKFFNVFLHQNQSKIPKDKLWNSPSVWSCQISKEKESHQETRKQCYLCKKPLPITSKKGLHPEGAAKTKCFQAIAFREKDPEGAFFKNGRTSHTKRRHKGAAGGRLPLKGTVSSFLLFHISFLAHHPCLQHAKMKQGGAVAFFGL